MSIEVMSLVISRKIGSPTRKAVLMIMADVAGDDGGGIYISKPNIARRAEVSHDTVTRAIRSMLKDGLIRKDGEHKISNGYTQKYRINLDAVSELEATKEAPKNDTPQNEGGADCPPDTPAQKYVTPPHSAPQTVREPLDNRPFVLSARENWNLMAEQNGLGEVGLITPERVRMLERSAEHLGSETAVLEAITKIPNIPHWVGANGWRCDFDWVFRDRNHVLKAYESKPPTTKELSHGNYQNKKPASANAKRQAEQVDGFRRAIESFTE